MLKKLLYILKFAIIIFFITQKSYALYPEKKDLKRDFGFGNVYVGAQVGNAVSGTFGVTKTEFGYSSFYLPTRFLQGGRFNASLGVRLLGVVRFEVEYSNIYQQYPVLKSDLVGGGGVTTNYKPLDKSSYGDEKLSNALAVNVIADIRYPSRKLYPYIGAGRGKGELEMFYVDTKLDETENGSGFGEKYCLDSSSDINECAKKVNINFNQFFGGMVYELTVLPVALNIEYRAQFGDKVKVYPKNDMHAPTNDELNNGYQYAVGEPKEVMFKNYSVLLGIKIML